jgi:hypothetical protein
VIPRPSGERVKPAARLLGMKLLGMKLLDMSPAVMGVLAKKEALVEASAEAQAVPRAADVKVADSASA